MASKRCPIFDFIEDDISRESGNDSDSDSDSESPPLPIVIDQDADNTGTTTYTEQELDNVSTVQSGGYQINMAQYNY